jgi:hypothetical protein
VLKSLIGAGLLISGLSANAQMNTKVYGYIDGYWEKVDDSPRIGTSEKSKNPSEFDTPNIHALIMSSKDSYKSFLNISGSGGGTLDVRNAWVEKEIMGEQLAFRIGKLYRKFGLYNEILDAVPTYIGIEPPEMFDGDHLMLTRTTNAMFHGKTNVGSDGQLNYAITTGNDERKTDAQSLGLDLNYTIGTNWKFGASYYTSGGRAVSDNQGSGNRPGSGGVLNWMEHDSYDVSGAYLQYTDAKWIIQVESYVSNHKATRDLAVVADLCTNATLNARQQARFGCGGTLNADGDYETSTTYIRTGYIIPLEQGSITPYVQYDVYENKETIWQKSQGGDNEAGLADDGQFAKATIGAVYRPDFNVAIKADYSQHLQDVNGKENNYGEVRFSFSYFWSL